MTAYRVIARRSGDWWALEAPDVPGAFSQVKRLEQAEDNIREAIALILNVEPDTITVDLAADLPDEETRAVHAAILARAKADEAARTAQAALREAAKTLTESLSQRDAGLLLDVSFQRVSQLLKDVDAPPRIPVPNVEDHPRVEIFRLTDTLDLHSPTVADIAQPADTDNPERTPTADR